MLGCLNEWNIRKKEQNKYTKGRQKWKRERIKKKDWRKEREE